MARFERYKEYLLGDYCYGLGFSEESGALTPQLRARYPQAHLQGDGHRRLLLRGRASPCLQP